MRPASVTALQAYIACPRKYFFGYVEWLPASTEFRGSRFALSQIVHAALTDYHASGDRAWETLDGALAARWDLALFSDSAASASQYHRARWMLWETFPAIADGNPVRFGYAFDTDFGGGRFRGRIDRLDDRGEALELVEYEIGERPRDRDTWGLQIYASVAAKLLRRPVRLIRILQLGADEAELIVTPEDARKVEGDVLRLRRAMAGDRQFAPKPDRHCQFCPYAPICDAAWTDPEQPRPSEKRPHELFRLYRAMEVLMEAGETLDAYRVAAGDAVRQLSGDAAVHWIEAPAASDEIRDLLSSRTETLGEIEWSDGIASLIPGGSLLVPVSCDGVAVFPDAVSRTVAEILGRGLRLGIEKAATYTVASFDGLTGLPRREIYERRVAALEAERFVLGIADVDRFKSVNDRHGHDAGDEALRMVAGILAAEAGVAAYRLGGEEFVLIFPTPDLVCARDIADRIRLRLEATRFTYRETAIPITASFGLAASRAGEESGITLKRADEALYRAKENGRNRVELADSK
jgi:diguanylate cyclase (GGDEF)-like protein